jgi:transcriptional regulator with XRE-family HTH domain
MHPRTIENYERGENDPKRSVPDLDTAEDLADGLLTTVAYLSGEIDDPDRDALKKMPAKNFHLSMGNIELADPDLMILLEKELAIISKLRDEKEKQERANLGSRKDSPSGN